MLLKTVQWLKKITRTAETQRDANGTAKSPHIANLLSVIEKFIKSGNLDSKSYEALRSSNPLSTILNFAA